MNSNLQGYLNVNPSLKANFDEIKTYSEIIKAKREKLIKDRQKRLDEARRRYYG